MRRWTPRELGPNGQFGKILYFTSLKFYYLLDSKLTKIFVYK